MANDDIKILAAGTGIRLWEIAEQLGINDSSFSRWLRRELPEEKKRHIIEIIQKIKEEKQDISEAIQKIKEEKKER